MRKFDLSRWFVPVVGGLAFAYLLVPIVYIFVFSFNRSGKTNLTWQGFTLDNWKNPCGAPEVCTAFANSIQIGLIATLVATVLGTFIAIGLERYRFKFSGTANLLVFLPMATPEVVFGAALLTQFLNLGVELGKPTIILAHIAFCISFVVVTVRARVASLDPALDEAAADLYASGVQRFFKITLPLLAPGIAAAALLSFALSFDDFIITNFNSGAETTFPKFIYIAASRGIPAEANVIGSFMFLLAIAVVVGNQIVSYRRRMKLAAR